LDRRLARNGIAVEEPSAGDAKEDPHAFRYRHNAVMVSLGGSAAAMEVKPARARRARKGSGQAGPSLPDTK
jgi:hypothetical protein